MWAVRTEQGDHAAALATVRPIAAHSPVSLAGRFYAGMSLIELKRYDEALGGLRALLDASPSDAAATAAVLNNLGVIVLRRGSTPQTGTAAYYFTKAADLDPDPDCMFNLGYAYAADRNYQGAVYWLREALRRDPADVDMGLILGIGFPPFRGGILRWSDTLGIGTVMQKLKKYESLGGRFQPTDLLRKMASESKSFYG